MNRRQFKTAFRVYREQGIPGVAKVLLQKMADTEPKKPAPSPVPTIPLDESWTEYMARLNWANAGMLTPGNAFCFDFAIRNLPSSSPIMEIGTFCGLSANMITYLKEKHGVKNPLITCDAWKLGGSGENGMLGDSKYVTHKEYCDYVKDSFIRNARLFSRYDLPYTIEMVSEEFFESWARGEEQEDVFGRRITLGGSLSFCYIDGNHAYESAKRDFENCDRYLEKHGFLMFDDSGDGTAWEVCRVVQEVLAEGRYELLAKNPNYFFRKK